MLKIFKKLLFLFSIAFSLVQTNKMTLQTQIPNIGVNLIQYFNMFSNYYIFSELVSVGAGTIRSKLTIFNPSTMGNPIVINDLYILSYIAVLPKNSQGFCSYVQFAQDLETFQIISYDDCEDLSTILKPTKKTTTLQYPNPYGKFGDNLDCNVMTYFIKTGTNLLFFQHYQNTLTSLDFTTNKFNSFPTRSRTSLMSLKEAKTGLLILYQNVIDLKIFKLDYTNGRDLGSVNHPAFQGGSRYKPVFEILDLWYKDIIYVTFCSKVLALLTTKDAISQKVVWEVPFFNKSVFDYFIIRSIKQSFYCIFNDYSSIFIAKVNGEDVLEDKDNLQVSYFMQVPSIFELVSIPSLIKQGDILQIFDNRNGVLNILKVEHNKVCHYPCITCENFNSETPCSECAKGFDLNPTEKKCVFKCASGQVFDSKDNTCKQNCGDEQFQDTKGVCGPCATNCKLCTSPHEANCSKCKNGFILSDQVCVAICEQAKYAENGKCEDCMRNCEQCKSKEKCEKCKNGYFFGGKGYCQKICSKDMYYSYSSDTCEFCPFGCLECESISQCNKCLPNFIFHELSCLKSCPIRFTENFNEKTCDKCKENCTQCLFETGDCYACEEGSFLYEGNCIKKCPSKTYLNSILGTCVKCKANCEVCDEEGCQKCIEGYYKRFDDICYPRPGKLSIALWFAFFPLVGSLVLLGILFYRHQRMLLIQLKEVRTGEIESMEKKLREMSRLT